MTPELQAWLDMISNFGVPVGMLAVIVVAAFKIIPVLLRRLKAASKQSDALTDCVPRMEEHLRRMADGNSSQLELLKEMNRKLDLLIGRG